MDNKIVKVLFLSDVITPPLTGIGRYAYEVASGLKNHSDIEDVQFFHNCNFIEDPKEIIQSGQVFTALKKNAPFRGLLRPIYQTLRKTLLNLKSKPYQGYILHSPNYYLFPFNGPKIVTIHDVSHLRYPECHPKDRIQYLNKHIPKAIAQANHIITVSEFSKREILEFYKIPESMVSVTPLAAASKFKPRTENETASILQKYKLIYGQYLLSVATFEPRKNLNRLIDAYASLPFHIKDQYPLILVGASGWENKDLHSKIKTLLKTENIYCLGYVSDDDLPYLYSGARGFAYPSLYEGFGLQVLESMASGIPIVTSNSTSLVEVAGDAGILVDPENLESIAAGLKSILTDDILRKEKIEKGFANAQKYSWKKCLDSTIKAYKCCLKNSGSRCQATG